MQAIVKQKVKLLNLFYWAALLISGFASVYAPQSGAATAVASRLTRFAKERHASDQKRNQTFSGTTKFLR